MASRPAPPPLSGLAWEALSARELGRLLAQGRKLRAAPRGSAAVLVLPCFGADDRSTLPLRGFLRGLGHHVVGWNLGLNRGDVPALLPRVAAAARALAQSHGGPVHLIGQSLGGVLARETARDDPQLVARVITLGTPVVGGPSHTRLAFAYSPERLAEISAGIAERARLPIRVPITAVYSKRDGIVSWRASIDRVSPNIEHVEVKSSHLGMGLDPEVWMLVARRL
jgi:pimeloyl-ACP methyl ester carboxylesterase